MIIQIPLEFKFEEEGDPTNFINNFVKNYPKQLISLDIERLEINLGSYYDTNTETLKIPKNHSIYLTIGIRRPKEFTVVANYIMDNLNKNIKLRIGFNHICTKEGIRKSLEEEYSRVVNKHKKVLPKLSHTKIPHDQIPNGVIISLKNSLRLLDDSILLASHSRYKIAIVISILASEEFSKSLILSEYFRNDKFVKPKEAKLIFSNHHYRLAELERFFHEDIMGFEKNSSTYAFMSANAEHYQSTKERYIYADWIKNNWLDPELVKSYKVYSTFPEKDNETALYEEFLQNANELLSNIKSFMNTMAFIKITKNLDVKD